MKQLLIISLCIIFIILLIPVSANISASGETPPKLSGMFVAPETVTGGNPWDQNDWNAAMLQLKTVGITDVVIQYSVQYYSDNYKVYYYTPKFETAGDDTSGRRNLIPYALKAAKDNNMNVWLGLHLAESAWFSAMDAEFADAEFLKTSAEYSKKLFNDLWSQFKGTYSDTIKGWYLPFEYNNQVKGLGKDRLINDFYKPLTSHIKSVTPNKTTIVSPLIYAPLLGTPSTAELNTWKELNKEIWANTQVDIIAPQDGCGWESTVKETIPVWYKVMEEGRVEAQKERDKKGFGKAIFWNNPECYSMNGTATMPIKRLIDNMAAVDKYVTGHCSFSMTSFVYFSETKGVSETVNEAYYKAYEYAVKNKKLFTPVQPIQAPSNFKAQITNGVDVSFSWDKIPDDKVEMMIAGYELWRKEDGAPDSSIIRIKEVPQSKEGQMTVIDYQTEPGVKYEYWLYAFDGTGNRSKTPAKISVSIDGYGMALNRKFGNDITSSVKISAGSYINSKLKYGNISYLTDGKLGSRISNWNSGTGAWTGFEMTDKNKTAKFDINIDNSSGKKIGFIYIQMLYQPTSDSFVPEKIDVLADGKHITSQYPFKEYYKASAGALWIPVDLKTVTSAKKITLKFTQKYLRLLIGEVRVYEATETIAARDNYKEPVNIVEGKPVTVSYSHTQNFNPDDHFRGVKTTSIDMLKGTMESNYFIYKGSYATNLLTRGLGKGPEVRWTDDNTNSVWMGITNNGSGYELSVDLKSASIVRGVETQWLLDRDAAVFLPNLIEIYGITPSGEVDLLVKAYRPSTAMIDFDKAPSATNTHRVETKSYQAICSSDKLYKSITIKVFPQYTGNTHFLRNLIVY